MGLHHGQRLERHALCRRDQQLSRRIAEHREGRGSKFAKRYRVAHLVYAEHFERADEAIDQETRIKGWKRAWKIALIEKSNPTWRDLYDTVHLD